MHPQRNIFRHYAKSKTFCQQLLFVYLISREIPKKYEIEAPYCTVHIRKCSQNQNGSQFNNYSIILVTSSWASTEHLIYYKCPKEIKGFSEKYTRISNGFEPVTIVFWTVNVEPLIQALHRVRGTAQLRAGSTEIRKIMQTNLVFFYKYTNFKVIEMLFIFTCSSDSQ